MVVGKEKHKVSGFIKTNSTLGKLDRHVLTCADSQWNIRVAELMP